MNSYIIPGDLELLAIREVGQVLHNMARVVVRAVGRVMVYTVARVVVHTVDRVVVHTVGRSNIKTVDIKDNMQENKNKVSKWGNSEDILPHFWQQTNMLCQVMRSQGESGKMCSSGAVQG